MSVYNNNLNISNLLVLQNSSFDSIEFCFLYATNSSFRNLKPEKQSKKIKVFKDSIGSQLENILNKKSKKSVLISSFNKDIHKSFYSDDPVPLNDFLFVIQSIVKSYKFIIAEKNSFSIHNNVSIEPNDKIIIIHKQQNTFALISFENQYIFDKSTPFIQIIESFHTDKDINSSVNLNDVEIEPVDDKVYIVDQDDIEFNDIDDDLIIKYKNKSFLQTFSTQEQIIHIQNLMVASDKHLYPSANAFISLFTKPTSSVTPFYNINHTKVSTVNKAVEDYLDYIQKYSEFKETFPNSPYYNSCYYQNEKDVTNNLLQHENVIRNSFTSTITKLDNTEYSSIDVESCFGDISTSNLQITMKKYKIDIKGSKLTICKSLVSYNFLEDTLSDQLNQYETKELKSIVEKYKIIIPKSSTKPRIIKAIIKESPDFLTTLLKSTDYEEIIEKHNLPFEMKDSQTMFALLSKVNVLELNRKNFNPDKIVCEIEDPVLEITISDLNIEPLQTHLETFKPFSNDKLSFDSFYLNGNPLSTDFEVFHVNQYINILSNIRKFLPIKCKLYYFDDAVIEGRITESLHNNTILKVVTKNNEITHYNLNNILDNKYFLYPSIYDSYKYKKSDINKNILFVIKNYDYNLIKQFVSLSFNEFINLYHIKLHDMKDINELLHKFNSSFFDINESMFESILDIVDNDVESNVEEVVNEKLTKESNHLFLQFNDENIDDLHKMFKLHSINYFQIIHDIFVEQYKKHSKNNLDTNVSFTKSNEPLHSIPVLDDSFKTMKEIDEYKKNVSAMIEENNNVLLTKRENQTSQYIDNLNDMLKIYSLLLDDYNNFIESPHMKTYLPEKFYQKTFKNLQGMSYNDNLLVSNDPLNQHSALEEEEEESNDLISQLLAIIGLKLTNVEKTFIERQMKTIIVPFLTKLKIQKNPKALNSESELTKWNHYSKTVGYCSFFTLFAQFKYSMEPNFPKCKSKFSLHGFPMDDMKEKTLTKYMSCVLYSLFNKSNNYFKSEESVDLQITAIIRLIFLYNPVIKQIFTNLPNNKVVSKSIHKNDMKPYDHISVKANKTNFEILLKEDHLLQYTTPYIPTQVNNKQTINLTNIKTVLLKSEEDMDIDIKDDMDELSGLLEEFGEIFKVTPQPSNLDKFIQTFVLQNKDTKIYYHIFNFNNFYRNLLNKYEDSFDQEIFYKYLVNNDETNIISLLKDIFVSFKSVIETMFETNDIKSHIHMELNPTKKNLFSILLNEFKSYIDNIMTKYENQFFDIEDLKKKAEILREEDKQQKLTKYDNMDDEQMYLYMQLEQTLGISLDIDIDVPTSDDVENEQITQLSEDDDIPE